MVVPDDLDRIGHLLDAVAMVEKKTFRLPRIFQRPCGPQLAIMISREDNRLAQRGQSLNQSPRLGRGRAVMDDVPDNDEVTRTIIRQELPQPVFDGSHPPHRVQPSRRALAQFVAKVKVCHRQPALLPVEERESSIQKDIPGDDGLARAQNIHCHAGARKLSLATGCFNP